MANENDENIIFNESCLEKACSDYDFDEFNPVGLRVLLVDDNQTCLFITLTMLRKLLYQVTACCRAEDALALLREDKNRFDIIISNLRMPEVDGFQLLEIVQLEFMDLPVVMMSAEDGKEFVLKGIKNGACDYLLKPVTIDRFKVIWQHVIRKKMIGFKQVEQPRSILENGELQLKQCKSSSIVVPQNAGINRTLKRRKDVDDENEAFDEVTTAKKPRITWTKELHQKFVTAVNQLGRDKAVPKKILERMKEMNVCGLTRENVASHLQKYRLYLQRLTEASNEIGHSHPYMEPKRSIFEQSSSLDATSGQLAVPSLNIPEASGFERLVANARVGMPFVDEWKLFESRIPESSFYPGIDLSTHDCPLGTTVAVTPTCKNPFSPSEEYEYMFLENTSQRSRNLSGGDSNEFTGGNMCEFMSDQPLLYVKYFDDQEETLPGPFA